MKDKVKVVISKQSVKIVFLILTLFLSVGVSLFAGGAQEVAKAGSLSIVTSAGLLEEGMRLSVSEYQKMYPNVKVEIVGLPDPGFTQKILQDFAAGSVPYDIAEIHSGITVVAVPSKWIIPLDKYIKAANIDMNSIYMKGYLDNATLAGLAKKLNPAGEFFALPTLPDLYQFVYRKDLYAQYGLAVANTWDEFISNCVKLTKPEKNFYGLVLSGSTRTDSHLPFDYYSLAFNLNGTYPIKPGTREVDFYSPGNVKAIQLYSDFINKYKVTPPGIMEYSYTEKNIAISQDRAAQMFQWVFGSTRTTEDSTRSKVAGKLGYSRAPGGAAPTGGWAIAITKDCKRPEAAFDFIKFHSIDMDAKKVVAYAAGGVTKAIANDPDVLKKYPFAPDFVKAGDSGKQIMMCAPDLPLWNEINDLIIKGVTKSIFDGENPDTACKWIADQIEKLIKESGLK